MAHRHKTWIQRLCFNKKCCIQYKYKSWHECWRMDKHSLIHIHKLEYYCKLIVWLVRKDKAQFKTELFSIFHFQKLYQFKHRSMKPIFFIYIDLGLLYSGHIKIKWYLSSISFKLQNSHNLSCLAVPLYLPCSIRSWWADNLNFVKSLRKWLHGYWKLMTL
jgi:hypothetical protein